jgi:hypothetical protein
VANQNWVATASFGAGNMTGVCFRQFRRIVACDLHRSISRQPASGSGLGSTEGRVDRRGVSIWSQSCYGAFTVPRSFSGKIVDGWSPVTIVSGTTIRRCRSASTLPLSLETPLNISGRTIPSALADFRSGAEHRSPGEARSRRRSSLS